jgi:biopolymer transport protein ExbB
MSFKLPSVLRSVLISLGLGLVLVTSTAWGQAPAAAPAATQSATETKAAAPSAITTKETIDNPYGLAAMWEHGDFVAKGTLFIMIFMSMGSWYILITKLMQSFKLAGQAKAARLKFFKAATLQEGLKGLDEGSAFRFIAQSGINAQEHHEGTLTEHIDRNTWVTMSVDRAVGEVQSRLQDGLAFLATVGSTAPFIGLFGTVWGIYHALTAIGIAGQASIDKVAGPVGEALIMTAIGLAVAVPAVLGYNWLVRRNKVALDGVRGFAADLHGVLMGAKTATGRTAR